MRLATRGPQLALRGMAGMIAVLMGLTAGCAGTDRAHPAARRAGTDAAMTAIAAADRARPPVSAPLPLDQFALTGGQSAEVYFLSLLYMKTCMVGQHYRYLPDLRPAEVAAGAKATAELDSRLWGISDLTVARQYGYHLPSWASGPGVPLTEGGMSAAERQAYDQCRVQSLQKLAADGLGPPAQLVAGLTAESWDAADRSPRLRAAFASWSACMRAHGYRYADPLQVAADAKLGNPKTGAPLPVTPAEIKTAVADIECKQSTSLLSIASSVQAAIQHKLVTHYAQQLARIKAQVQQQARELALLAAQYGIPRQR